MIQIRYPGSPEGVDMDAIERAVATSRERADMGRAERQGNKAFEGYLSTLYGGQTAGQPQQQPMSLSALGGVQRAPLPPVQDMPSQRVSQAHGDGDSNQIFGRFIKTVRDGGVTNPNALAAIAATGKHESGYDPKNVTGTWSDPSQSGQAGTSGGILSWRGPRLAAMQQFAQQNGDNPNAPTPETQAKFLLSENPQLIQQLQQAKSPQEAQQMMNNAWRFAGYDQPGGEAGARVQTAMGYAGQFGGQDGGAVGAVSDQFSGQPQPVQQPPAAPQGGPSGGDLLPPREIMLGLFKSKDTRPLAIALAQSAQKMQRGDPMAQIEYQTAVAKLQKLQDGEGDVSGAFGNLDAQARAAGLEPGSPQYQDFMRNGGGEPATYRALKLQALDAGYQPGTPEYEKFMASRGSYEAGFGRQSGSNAANIDSGGAAAQATELGQGAAKFAQTAYESRGKIQSSIANIDKAIEAIDGGAETGLVYNMLPNVTEASASLQNAMDNMGLDVVGSVTFGALSEGEMRLAMSVAAPRDLQAPELKQWLIKKREAQVKAQEALTNAALYLSTPGNTINGWMQQQQGGGTPAGGGDVIDWKDL